MSESANSSWRKWILVGGTSIASLFGLLLLLSFDVRWGDILDRRREPRILRLGYAVEPPFSFVSETGEVIGESPELAKAIIEQMGDLRIVWIQTRFEELIPELISGRFDGIAAGLLATAERRVIISFSEPTFQVGSAFLVHRGNPRKIRTFSDVVRRPDVRIAVLPRSVEATMLKELGAAPHQIVFVPDAQTGKAAVESDRADALSLSSPSVRWLAREANLDVVETDAFPLETELERERKWYRGAFAFRKGDESLLRRWNAAQSKVVGSEFHRDLLTRFGFRDHEVPDSETQGSVSER